MRTTVLLVVQLAFLTGQSVAQGAPARPLLSLGVNGGLFLVGGTDFSGTDDGPGFEIYAGYHAAGQLDINTGFHYSTHGVGGSNLNLIGIIVEPRFSFSRPNAPVAAFLGGRAAWIRRSVSSFSSTGFAFGGVAGLAFGPATWPVRIETAMSGSYLSFASAFSGGSRDTGSAIGLQVGINVPLYTPTR